MTVRSVQRNPFLRLFDWKVRGIRWIEIIGLMLVAVMVFSVYLAKAGAAQEGSQISELERKIDDNGQRVRLLRAEVARLEQPARLEALSRSAGLGPVQIHRRTSEDNLPAIAPVPEPRPVIISPTTGPAPGSDTRDQADAPPGTGGVR